MRAVAARLAGRPQAVAALLALAAFGCTTAMGPADEEHDATADQLVALLASGDCGAAAVLFHYPEELQGASLQRDRQGVARQLEILCELWGPPGEVASAGLPLDIGEIGVFSGTLAYWTAKPRHGIDAERGYRVRFARAGAGFVRVAQHASANRSRARSVAFAIDLRREGAFELLDTTLERLLEVLGR